MNKNLKMELQTTENSQSSTKNTENSQSPTKNTENTKKYKYVLNYYKRNKLEAKELQAKSIINCINEIIKDLNNLDFGDFDEKRNKWFLYKKSKPMNYLSFYIEYDTKKLQYKYSLALSSGDSDESESESESSKKYVVNNQSQHKKCPEKQRKNETAIKFARRRYQFNKDNRII